jgi:hypothetical protein
MMEIKISALLGAKDVSKLGQREQREMFEFLQTFADHFCFDAKKLKKYPIFQVLKIIQLGSPVIIDK